MHIIYSAALHATGLGLILMVISEVHIFITMVKQCQ